MSLIYQSLKKLQSEEKAAEGAPDPHPRPGRKFRPHHAVWFLLGLGLLTAGVYGSWIIFRGDSSQSPSPRTAQTKAVNHSTETPPSLAGTNASLDTASKNRSADRPHSGNETGSPKTDRQAVASAKGDPPKLLGLFRRRNGTRARLGLEFDRQPKAPETNWDGATKSLGLTFSRARAKDPESLEEQATRLGIDLALSSKKPLRLRLECPDLKEYSAFTLPGSEEYGPRYILALRFDRNTETNSGSAEKQSRTSPSGEPEAGRVTAQSEQARENVEKEEETDQREENRQPESTQEDVSGSMEVASNTHEQQTQDLSEDGPARIRRLLKQNRDDRAARFLRRRLRRNPDSIALRARYADVLISEQRYGLALQALQMGNLPSVRHNPGYYARVAYARRKLGRHEPAARVYRTLARNEPQEGRWWMGLGLCLERMERTEAALGAYERALDSSGLDGDVRAFLKQRLIKLDSGRQKD